MEELDAYSVAEFSRRHGFSPGHLYALWRDNRGPRYMQLGDRRLITAEAAADWRREREREAAESQAA